MTPALDEELLSRLSDVVSERLGLSFPKERWGDLERGLRTAAPELGFDSVESTLHWFLSTNPDRRHTETLASHLTVGETYFFRDPRTFRALREHILPSLISLRSEHRRLRLWSAGCCTGEEPYSLAILLHSLIPDYRQWTITILATDINPRFLQKAARGVYGEWSFRETPSWIKEQYFTQTREGRFEILPIIKDSVVFAPLNLVDDSYPSFLTNTNAMDLVLCRNVLMYFRPQTTRSVAAKLSQSLMSDGWLLVSPSEMSQALFPEFETAHVGEALCYRKRARSMPVAIASQEFIPLHPEIEPQTDVSEIQSTAPEPAIPTSMGDEDPSVQETEPSQDLREIAYAEYERGAFDLAASHIQTLLEIQPEDASLVALLARSLANQGDLDGAEALCLKAIKTDKLNPVLRYLHATIVHEIGRDDDAIHSLQESIYLNPDFPLSHFLLGTLSLRGGNGKQADRHFHWAMHLLASFSQQDVLPDSEGMTAGRLMEIVETIIEKAEA